MLAPWNEPTPFATYTNKFLSIHYRSNHRRVKCCPSRVTCLLLLLFKKQNISVLASTIEIQSVCLHDRKVITNLPLSIVNKCHNECNFTLYTWVSTVEEEEETFCPPLNVRSRPREKKLDKFHTRLRVFGRLTWGVGSVGSMTECRNRYNVCTCISAFNHIKTAKRIWKNHKVASVMLSCSCVNSFVLSTLEPCAENQKLIVTHLLSCAHCW